MVVVTFPSYRCVIFVHTHLWTLLVLSTCGVHVGTYSIQVDVHV